MPDSRYDPEAVIQDADIEMAEMEQVGNAIARQRSKGICTHQSVCGVSASGEVLYPEQRGLRAGQVACTEHTGGCDAVFETSEDWYAAMDGAIDG